MPGRTEKGIIAATIVLTCTCLGAFIVARLRADPPPVWECLGQPPEVPVGILAIAPPPHGLRSTCVCIEAASGRAYRYCGEVDTSWTEIERSEASEWSCGPVGKRRERHLKDEIANRAVTWCSEWESGEAIYAIRADGTVWRWLDHWGFADDFPDFFAIWCVGAPSGLVAGLLVVGLVLWRFGHAGR